MSSGTKKERSDHMVVFTADGDDIERREMADILRKLAEAMDEESYVGNPLLVLEERCYERLKGLHHKGKAASGK